MFDRPGAPPLFALLMMVLCFAGTAPAQENKTTARALALEGQEAFEAGNYQRAADLLSRAEKYYHAPPHLVLEARARLQLGQLVEARELLLAVVNEPSGTQNDVFDRAREDAEGLLEPLEPRVPRVTIEVEPKSLEGLELEMDDQPWSTDLLGVASPINPGNHVLVARATGYQEQRIELVLVEGQKERVPVELEPTTAGAEAPPPGTAPPATLEDQGGAKKGPPVLSYALWGTGLVGVGVGTAFLLMGADKSGQAQNLLDEQCTPLAGGGYGCSMAVDEQVRGLDDDAAGEQTIGAILVGVGVAALVGGTVLALLPGKKKEVARREARPRWSAVPLPGGALMTLQGEFR